MNRMIKNIFVATALAITFAPALHCTNKEVQTTSKSRLQSAIDYVKNMGKPLTTQEKLAQHIAQADVAGFKTAYDAFMQSDVTPAERTTITQALIANAQEVKQELQTAIDAMGNAQANKKMLAKGIAQGIGSGALLALEACLATVIYKQKLLKNKIITYADYDAWEDKNPSLVDCALLGQISAIPLTYLGMKAFGIGSWGNRASFYFAILVNTALGAYGLKTGIQNCKNGWNYKAYLQQQIKNIDEICEYITAKQQ